MDSVYNNIVCIRCGGTIQAPSLELDTVSCRLCGQGYPLILRQIPLFVNDAQIYLASLYFQHHRYIQHQQQKIAALNTAGNESPDRREVLSLIAKGIGENIKVIESICSELSGYLSLTDLARAINAPQFIGYTSIFEYLERDWCWLPAGEQELSIIRNALFEKIDQYSPDRKSALVLGAGTGRIGWELLDRFEQVFALDVSLTMAQLFHKVLREGVPFYSINTSSISSSHDMAKIREAGISSQAFSGSYVAQMRQRLTYLIGDVCHAPLADQSISAIISVYFTDVVPLRQYLQQIRRILKPKGVFLHFGPLQYHFDDIGQHLSAEQVRQLFEENGFEVCTDEYIASEHLNVEGSMSIQSFKNWVFAARSS